MSILGSIPIIGDLIDGVKDIVSEAVVDKDKKIAIEAELEKLADRANERLHEQMIAQTEINKTEAEHRSIFVAGWRPFIGWMGGLGVAWTFLLSPIFEWISRLFGWTGEMPAIDASQLMTLVLAMLGVAGMRSYDKMKGTSNDVLPITYKKEKKGFPKNIIPENVPWMK